MTKTCDLLVIGAGPAGAAASYWAAKRGASVLAVDKKTFPREKTCGDGLTPRAVKELRDMGVEDKLSHFHRYQGLRVKGHGQALELPWPDHPIYPDYGYVVRRRDLDQLLTENSQAQGAEIWFGNEAVKPIFADRDGAESRTDRTDKTDAETDQTGADNTAKPAANSDAPPLLAGAQIRDTATGELTDVYARGVIVADGANSRFGRALGCARNRKLAYGMAIRTYYESPAHDDPWLESALDIKDRQGNSIPGYGWVFPLGNGSINTGIGVLSTFRDYKSLNTSWLMEEWAHALADDWGIDPAAPEIAPVGGKLPLGGSVSPKAGPNWMVAGDAAGTINPFNGEGIDYAYETGRAAANMALDALGSGGTGGWASGNGAGGPGGTITSTGIGTATAAGIGLGVGTGELADRYQTWLTDTYGMYFKVGQLFAKAVGNPDMIRRLTRAGLKSQTIMEWAFRIMANMLRPNEYGPAELAYVAMKGLARMSRSPGV